MRLVEFWEESRVYPYLPDTLNTHLLTYLPTYLLDIVVFMATYFRRNLNLNLTNIVLQPVHVAKLETIEVADVNVGHAL